MTRTNVGIAFLLVAVATPALASPIPPGTTPLRFFGFWWGPGYHSQNRWCNRGPASGYAYSPEPIEFYPGNIRESVPQGETVVPQSVLPQPTPAPQAAPPAPEQPNAPPPSPRGASRTGQRAPMYVPTPYGLVPWR